MICSDFERLCAECSVRPLFVWEEDRAVSLRLNAGRA